jgi:transposase
MPTAARQFAPDPLQLQSEILRLEERLAESKQERDQAIAARDQRIAYLLDYIALLKRKRFAPSSERLSPDQLALFDEAELEALIADLERAVPLAPEPAVAADEPASAKVKAKPVRSPLPEHLPRVERVIDLPAAVKAQMGGDWKLIGYDASEQLAIIPRQPYVIRILRAKYAPAGPDVPGAEQGVVIAPRAPQILPKSLADSSLLADIAVAKFADALPLYRQERIFAREGIEISRQTMAGWLIQLDEKLAPIAAAMTALLAEGAVLQVDETRLQVLEEPDRKATQQSFMWVYRGGTPERPVILFDYSETRGLREPRRFLGGIPASIAFGHRSPAFPRS